MNILDVWKELPPSTQGHLAKQYGFRTYGTTDEQLLFDLENKMPLGILVVPEVKKSKQKREKILKEEVKVEKVEEVVVKSKKRRKRK